MSLQSILVAVGLFTFASNAPAQTDTAAGRRADLAAQTSRRAAAKPGAAACRIEGVWQLESANWGGREQPMNGVRERKIVTRGHWMWLSADAKRDTIPLRSLADTLRSQQVTGGAGTYTVNGNSYTEHLDMLFLPSWEGRDVPAKCETDANHWVHTWHYDTTKVVEHWRRLR